MDIPREIERRRAGRPYQNYLAAREAVLAMRAVPLERIPTLARPSDYWAEELNRFLYMFDASPLIIEQLRHHSHHITGIQAYNYRSHSDRKEGPKFHAKLEALRSLDDHGLFVPEARELGGFGHDIDGKLVNIDTLKYYECMIAMDRGGALASLRQRPERHVVMEIGSGWGGLAYTFKSLFPDTCYVLVDFPELFLFSASYLMTLFPEARVAFVLESGGVEGNWADYDFVFVPNTLQEHIGPERLDLTINTVSFQEMTTEQVRAYVELAAALDCPLLYSLNRKRSLYATQLTDVHEIISEQYTINEIPMLAVPYTKMLDPVRKDGSVKVSKKAPDDEAVRVAKEDLNYKHVVGRKKT